MKLSLSILAGTVLATALFSTLTACSEDPPTSVATGGTGATPNMGGSSGSSGSSGTGGSAGASASGGSSSGNGGTGASSSGAAGSSGGGAAGSCSIATRADPIAGGGGMSGGAGLAGGGRSAGGASSGGTSAGGMSAGGASSGGMGAAGMSSAGTSSGGMSTGGTGGTGSDNPYEPTWDTLKLVLSGTNPPCSASDCHGNGGPNVLWLPTKDDAALWKYLSTHVSIQCGNLPVVDPGHPEHSALIKILKGPCVGPCGITPRMPKDCEDSNPPNCLEDDVISALEQWIAMGASHP